MKDIEQPSEDISLPLMSILQAVDELTKRAVPYQQTLLYAQNLLPEYLECAYKTKLLITKTYSVAHNTAMLYGELGDAFALKLANYNIEYFINSAVDMIKTLFDNKDIEIKKDFGKNCKKVVLDIRRTSLILFNLISNSIIHSHVKNKVIKISARLEGNVFILSVHDNGKGIPKSQVENLFCAYKDKLTASKIKETSGGLFNFGTGLAVSRKVAAQMQGTLSYISTNQGAKFELSIPQVKQPTSLGETIEYSPSYSEVEECLADSLLYILSQ